MGGFLQKLDKRRTRRSGGGPQADDIILRKSEAPVWPVKREQKKQQTTILLTSREPSPEGLLAELIGFTKKKSNGATERGATKQSEGDAPAWQIHSAVRAPQLDVLLPIARRIVAEIITPDLSEKDLEALAKRAVALAAQEISAHTYVTSRDTYEATRELIAIVRGKGPLQPLFDDPLVTDLYIDDWNSVRCKRQGKAIDTPCIFRAPSDYEAFCDSLIQQSGQRLTPSNPRIDVVLQDDWGTRVNLLHGSLRNTTRPGVVIRIPRLQSATMYDLLRSQTLPAPVAAWLSEFMAFGEWSILVVGASGSGKTTAATALLNAVGSDERVVCLEHLVEIRSASGLVEKLSLAPSRRGEPGLQADELLDVVRARSPRRIVFGEVRDKDRAVFVELLAEGYPGSIATMCSDDARDAISRLTAAGSEPRVQQHLQQTVSRSIRLVLRLQNVDGRPCLAELCEVMPSDAGSVRLISIARYEGDAKGRRVWRKLVHSSPLLDLMSERGVDMLTGATLLAPPDKESPVHTYGEQA